ncbi:hypothetical protein QWY87_13175 [Lutimonas halocynthiae]|uniref:hypothetical protein n=1 Tax=Lutimonas halocynthiae TaxID=1446477 RepID=UPI0025B55BA5|nr:hypothetical protein [Lutimonas halocynthiae]MDN3643662.1 hypothetical protein [Lutimonas halocynthiae]
MIRIFITAILYFIGMFTQAQDNPNKDILGKSFSTEVGSFENYVPPCNLQNAIAFEFEAAKFEVINKDLTFDSRF